MYPVIAVPDEAGDILEQLGTKRKFWFSDAASKLKATGHLVYLSHYNGA